jgi:hypothetical protein
MKPLFLTRMKGPFNIPNSNIFDFSSLPQVTKMRVFFTLHAYILKLLLLYSASSTPDLE